MTHARRHPALFVSLAALSLAAACSGAAEGTRPETITAGEATGETFACTPEKLAGDLSPFVVDWSDGQRAALEAAMKRGVAVVKMTCEGPQIMKACQVLGDYSYVGVSPKTKAVSMKDAGKAAANFGGFLGTSVAAAFSQGRSLELAYVLVGTNSTTVPFVERQQLRGRCDGATHFVYEAQLGAFAMETRESGEAATSAEILGAGDVSADVSSSKETRTTDGDPGACEWAGESDTAPTEGCSALMRVELMTISADGTTPGGPVEAGTPVALGCPDGYVYADGACEAEAVATFSLCDDGDRTGCTTQCAAGSVESCDRLAAIELRDYLAIRKDYPADGNLAGNFAVNARLNGFATERAAQREDFGAACASDHASACSLLGVINYHTELPLPESDAVGEIDDMGPDGEFDDMAGLEDQEMGTRGYVFADAMKGCRLGENTGCWLLRDNIDVHIAPEEYTGTLDRSCAAGNAVGCALATEAAIWGIAGDYLNPGMWFPDFVQATHYAERACTGGVTRACGVAAALYADTQGPCKDLVAEASFGVADTAIDWGMTKYFCDHHNKNHDLTSDERAWEMLTIGCEAGHQAQCDARSQHFGAFDESIWIDADDLDDLDLDDLDLE